eukprot:scaffold2541_cov175-Amphora_coffeaeformis.AAC.13
MAIRRLTGPVGRRYRGANVSAAHHASAPTGRDCPFSRPRHPCRPATSKRRRLVRSWTSHNPRLSQKEWAHPMHGNHTWCGVR